MVKCTECGSNRTQWRCNNKEQIITKYKCKDCGAIIKIPMENREKTEFAEFFSNLIHEITKEKKQGDIRLSKNYTQSRDGGYTITKMKNGETYYVGRCNTEEQAKTIVEKMNECNWDMKQANRIRRTVMNKC